MTRRSIGRGQARHFELGERVRDLLGMKLERVDVFGPLVGHVIVGKDFTG
jgi:hypothetical protein